MQKCTFSSSVYYHPCNYRQKMYRAFVHTYDIHMIYICMLYRPLLCCRVHPLMCSVCWLSVQVGQPQIIDCTMQTTTHTRSSDTRPAARSRKHFANDHETNAYTHLRVAHDLYASPRICFYTGMQHTYVCNDWVGWLGFGLLCLSAHCRDG